MVTCNLMTGAGLNMGFAGSFGMAWLGIVIMFFIFAFGKRWVFEELLQVPFNLWLGFAGGAIVYFFTVQFMCSPRFAIVFGLIAGLAAGYFGGMMFDQGGE